ncbi:unnamed protein product [Miscanthus lutarioriparius]|uniref:Uncharacterized protein n=1 Tax=Miscanthus lutarioriparius TaxID=422564 RepID=A0A811RK30_9POAL|nr:unnamed protein product [Miscanthus lutarioriparius]
MQRPRRCDNRGGCEGAPDLLRSPAGRRQGVTTPAGKSSSPSSSTRTTVTPRWPRKGFLWATLNSAFGPGAFSPTMTMNAAAAVMERASAGEQACSEASLVPPSGRVRENALSQGMADATAVHGTSDVGPQPQAAPAERQAQSPPPAAPTHHVDASASGVRIGQVLLVDTATPEMEPHGEMTSPPTQPCDQLLHSTRQEGVNPILSPVSEPNGTLPQGAREGGYSVCSHGNATCIAGHEGCPAYSSGRSNCFTSDTDEHHPWPHYGAPRGSSRQCPQTFHTKKGAQNSSTECRQQQLPEGQPRPS